jgi:hypothetical protein
MTEKTELEKKMDVDAEADAIAQAKQDREQAKHQAMDIAFKRTQSIVQLANQLLVGSVQKFGLGAMKTSHIHQALDLAEQFGMAAESMYQDVIHRIDAEYKIEEVVDEPGTVEPAEDSE